MRYKTLTTWYRYELYNCMTEEVLSAWSKRRYQQDFDSWTITGTTGLVELENGETPLGNYITKENKIVKQ